MKEIVLLSSFLNFSSYLKDANLCQPEMSTICQRPLARRRLIKDSFPSEKTLKNFCSFQKNENESFIFKLLLRLTIIKIVPIKKAKRLK
ncbi:hypothetical protein ISS37_01375 [candidate division KSB1 bacterium]|nr:hypothetical protein [candidate division KSB1 bacterium]